MTEVQTSDSGRTQQLRGDTICKACGGSDSCTCFQSLEEAFLRALRDLGELQEKYVALRNGAETCNTRAYDSSDGESSLLQPNHPALYYHLMWKGGSQTSFGSECCSDVSRDDTHETSLLFVEQPGICATSGYSHDVGQPFSSITQDKLTQHQPPDASRKFCKQPDLKKKTRKFDECPHRASSGFERGRIPSQEESAQLRLAQAVLTLNHLRRQTEKIRKADLLPQTSQNHRNCMEKGLTVLELQQKAQVVRTSCLLLRVDVLFLCSEMEKMLSVVKTSLATVSAQKRKSEDNNRVQIAALRKLLDAPTAF